MKMSAEVQKALAECGPGLVATASKSGKPNVSPKGSFRVLDEEHVMFADVHSPRTMANLKENPQVSVICIKDRKGVRIWGKAEILTSGPVFDQVAKEFAARSRTVNAVAKIKVEEVASFSA